MDRELQTLCEALAAELWSEEGFEISNIRPLTGGVASDIASLSIDGTDYCMKFAREKLQVAEDWFAPLHRNEAEYAWLNFVGTILPDCAPKLFGQSQKLNGFVMEYVSGEGVYLWKDRLLKGHADPEEARAVANCLGRIHSESAKPDFDRSKFNNGEDFKALRLEPYLSFLAGKYPKLAEHILGVEKDLDDAHGVLVHGDVSPKNILFRNDSPIILDAECATMGDASFDVSFCLNHLVLKAFNAPAHVFDVLSLVTVFWDTYSSSVNWEDVGELEKRVCALLPILMLARIDGKSPVEYLTEDMRIRVRSVSIDLISKPKFKLLDLIAIIKAELS